MTLNFITIKDKFEKKLEENIQINIFKILNKMNSPFPLSVQKYLRVERNAPSEEVRPANDEHEIFDDVGFDHLNTHKGIGDAKFHQLFKLAFLILFPSYLFRADVL